MKINQGNLVKLMVVAALALGALSCGAMAQSVTWTGTGAGVGWSDSNNWLTSGTTPNEGDQLVFGGVVGLSSSNDVSDNFTYSSITFNSGAGAFTLTGSSVGLTGGITNNSANAQTLSFSNYLLSSTQGGIYLKASQTWNAASGDLVITANVSSFNIDGSTPTTLLTVTGGSNTTISGFLNEDTGGGASVLSVLKTGAGRLTLSGNNTYSGGTTLNQGILNLGSVGALGTLGTITFSGGTLQYSVSNNIDYSSRFSQASNQQYNVDTNGRDVTWASNLLSSGGSFSKVGLGTLTITGSIGVDAGDNIVDGGTLDIETTGTFTAPNYTFYVGKSGTAALILNGGNLTTGWTSLGENTASYGSVTVNSGTWSSSGQFWVGKSGTGSLTINGGLVTANGFTYIGEDAGATGSVTVNSGTFNLPSSPFFLGDSGTGSLIINGGYVNLGDAVYLGNNSNSTGSLTVTSGTLQNSGGVFYVGFSGTGSLNISGGTVNNSYVSIGEAANSYGAATVTGAVWTIANDLTIGQSGTGTLSLSGSGVLNIGGNVYLAVDPGSVGTLNFGDFTTGTFNAPVVNGGNGTATVNFNNTTNYTFTPQLTGTLSVNLLGSGTTTLTGNNTYSGPTNLASGQLNINSATAIGVGTLTLNASTIIDNTSGALITLANNNTQNWGGSFTFVGTNALNLGTGAVFLLANTDVQVSGSNLTVGGAIGGSYSLSKSGTGTLFLTGTSFYNGTTAVNAGNLVVSGSLTATTGVTVANGANLQLVNGLVNTSGLVTVASGGTLSVTGGESSVGAVALNAGATFQTTISNSAHAVLNTTGGVEISLLSTRVTLSINSNGYTPNYTQGNLSASDKFVLILGNGTPVAGNFANAISLFDPNYSQTLNEYTDGNGNVWAVFYNVIGTTNLTPGTGNDVSVVLIPEPSTWAMLLGGFGLLGFVQRLRRRSA